MVGTGAARDGMSSRAAAPERRAVVKAYPVPEGPDAPEPSVPPEISETIYKTSQNAPQARLVVDGCQAVR